MHSGLTNSVWASMGTATECGRCLEVAGVTQSCTRLHSIHGRAVREYEANRTRFVRVILAMNARKRLKTGTSYLEYFFCPAGTYGELLSCKGRSWRKIGEGTGDTWWRESSESVGFVAFSYMKSSFGG